MSYDQSDVEHLMDLLQLLPWEVNKDDKGWHIPRGDLWDALDGERWALLANGQLDYSRLRNGSRDPSTVWKVCMYMLDVFDGAPTAIVTEAGALVAHILGPDVAPAEAIGRRWCEDLAATAWRIVVPYIAHLNRPASEDSD